MNVATEFNIVQFTPDPEEIEPANVALLLKLERPRLVFDERFPRLACLAPWFDHQPLLAWFNDLKDQVRIADSPSALHLLSHASSQLRLSEPRKLVMYPSDEIEQMLVSRYLRRRAPPAQRAQILERQESRLDQYLVERLHVRQEGILRRASPHAFLGPKVFDRLGGNGFTIPRVVVGRRHLVLISDLNLDAPAKRVETQAQSVAFHYFHLGRVRKDVREIDNREMHRATVLFGDSGERGDSPGRLESAKEMVGRDSDLVARGHAPNLELQEIVREALADLL